MDRESHPALAQGFGDRRTPVTLCVDVAGAKSAGIEYSEVIRLDSQVQRLLSLRGVGEYGWYECSLDETRIHLLTDDAAALEDRLMPVLRVLPVARFVHLKVDGAIQSPKRWWERF